MIARDLADLLMQTPDVEVTVQVDRGDSSDEDTVDGVVDWGSFVSIQRSRTRRGSG